MMRSSWSGGTTSFTGDDVPSTYRAYPVAVTLDASDDGGSGFYRTYYRTGVDPPAPTTASAAYDPSARPVSTVQLMNARFCAICTADTTRV